jgi:deoxyribonuclease-4
MPLGAHISIAGGVDKAILRGHEVGCEIIQIFTRSPRQWRPRVLDEEEILRFFENKQQTGIDPVVARSYGRSRCGCSWRSSNTASSWRSLT